MPNLASRAMGLALRNLPEQWQEKHGFRPLLAEIFTDIESFEGTCYKASNWEPRGLTKGFERSHRVDFYREHKRPKKLWLKTFSHNTRVILIGLDLPATYLPGCNLQTAERALVLKKTKSRAFAKPYEICQIPVVTTVAGSSPLYSPSNEKAEASDPKQNARLETGVLVNRMAVF